MFEIWKSITFDPVSVSFLIGNHQARHIQTRSCYRVIELVDDGYKMRFTHTQVCSTGIRAYGNMN